MVPPFPGQWQSQTFIFNNYFSSIAITSTLLSNIEKILGEYIIEFINSSLVKILSIPYNLVLDKNIQQFMPSLALLKILGKI